MHDAENILALAGLNVIEMAGFTAVCSNHLADKRIIVRQQDRTSADADCWIVSPDFLLRHLDFFMPRRSKVIVYPLSNHGDPTFTTIAETDSQANIARIIAQKLHRKEDEMRSRCLSARETDVLRLLAKGMTAKEIASELCISVNTVLTHRKNISAKLGIKSISGLSLYAMMNGIK